MFTNFFSFFSPIVGVTAWTAVDFKPSPVFNLAGAGGPGSALTFGGTNLCYTFNGASWVRTADFPTQIQTMCGCGTSANAFSLGGFNLTYRSENYIFDGTSWSNAPSLVVTKGSGGALGNTTSALTFGGNSGGVSTNSQIYDGTSWANTGNLVTASSQVGAIGTANNGLCIGGNNVGNQAWNGATWSASPIASVDKRTGSAAAGNTTLGVVFGGYGSGGSTTLTTSEIFNGTSWAVTASLNTPRINLTGCGTGSNAISIGGRPNTSTGAGGSTGRTEIFNYYG